MPAERPEPAAQESPTDDDLTMAATPEPGQETRRLVFVAGSGRSGTSLMAGVLKHLGLHVPEPEVVADPTNPRGFGEPRWVVDFHEQLLRRANVAVADARPQAWFDAGRVGMQEPHRAALTDWLEQQFGVADGLVVKDPRIAWFLSMWRVAAVRTGARSATLTMLRHPAEVVGSKNASYGGRIGDITRLAGWVNVMLCTERATRGSARGFVRHQDLLADWTSTVVGVADRLAIPEVGDADVRQMQEVHGFVDPQLHRVRATWDDLAVPAGLREVAEAAWQQLDRLAEPDGDHPEVHRALDDVRRRYAELYAEAEAVASSSITAAGPAHVRSLRRAKAAPAKPTSGATDRVAEQPGEAPAATPPAAPAAVRARRAAGRLKRRLRGA